MNKLKSVLRLNLSTQYWPVRKSALSPSSVTVCSLFLALISLILTVMNIVKGYRVMTASTSVLVIGFLLSALAGYRKKRIIASIILMLLTSATFTYYALSGQNEGFAILWTLAVPIIAMNLLSLELGFILSGYFQLFLAVLFYSPLKNIIPEGTYSATFMARYPILYFCVFGGVLILAMAREYYNVQKTLQSYTDGLTGLLNRTSFVKALEQDYSGVEYSIVSLDLNGLKRVNDSFGHDAGDRLITSGSQALLAIWPLSHNDVYRLGGDEFAVVTKKVGLELRQDLDRFEAYLESFNERSDLPVFFAYGTASSDAEGITDMEALNRIADQRMYQNKEEYYSRHENERRKAR